jgi:hypothetical protein
LVEEMMGAEKEWWLVVCGLTGIGFVSQPVVNQYLVGIEIGCDKVGGAIIPRNGLPHQYEEYEFILRFISGKTLSEIGRI